jgi:hypothetical protein
MHAHGQITDATERQGNAELVALGERIARTAALIDAATEELLRDLRDFDAAEGWAAQGALSCAHWLAWRTGMDLGAARERVRVARALGALPHLEAALARAEVSYSKVRAMTRVATPENESALLELAASSTAAQLERVCRTYRRVAAPPDGAPGEVEAGRWMRLRELDDGYVRLEVRLTPDEAALVVKAAEISAEGQGHAAGLVALAEHALRGGAAEVGEVGEAGKAREGAAGGRPPVEVMVHVDATTLAGEVEGGAAISAETSRRLLCDAGVVPVLEDARGTPLDVGRRTRTIPAALRRALRARDRGCRFPGCSNRMVDGHHLRHWAEGGETSLGNLVSLCRRHHGLLHEGGFRAEPRGEGFVFFAPDGREVPASGRVARLLEPALEVLLRGGRAGLRASWPGWDGERLDLEAAVDALSRTGRAPAAAAPPTPPPRPEHPPAPR